MGIKKELLIVRDKDWSLNLEDPFYEDNEEIMLSECIDAIKQTKQGCYVNLVTPGSYGDPNDWLIPQLKVRCKSVVPNVREIRYIDECGCGGFVTRVYR